METTNSTKGSKMTITEMLFNASDKVANAKGFTQQVSISGNEFKGLNNSILSLEQQEKNYQSNVWYSQKQLEEIELTLKEDQKYGVQLFTKNIKDNKVTIRYWTVYNEGQLQPKAS